MVAQMTLEEKVRNYIISAWNESSTMYSRTSPLELAAQRMVALEIFLASNAWDFRGSAYKMLATVLELPILLMGIPAVSMSVQGETPKRQPKYLRTDPDPISQLE